MNNKLSRSIIFLSTLILGLSSILLLINQLLFKYPANNYFPEKTWFVFSMLILSNLGLRIYYPFDNRIRQIGRELVYFFIIMSIVAFATNAVQLTPFLPIDSYVVKLEEAMRIHMTGILNWTHNYPLFKQLLGIIYASLDYQMCYIPLLIILTCKFHLIREYYFFMLCTVLLGFGFYYFFPTTAPASIINSPFFFPEQIDTGLKFKQIHHYIIPTTNQGGLIALPSFHTIWAILCINLLREWTVPFILLLLINSLLILSCVLLGWHYPIDILGGFIVLLISYALWKYCSCHRY